MAVNAQRPSRNLQNRSARRYTSAWRGRWLLAATATALTLAATPASAILVDCDTPDDFCTGDPCVTTAPLEITVASCVLDFSPRALVVTADVIVPNAGALSLTAGSIDIQDRINGRHVSNAAGDGADISLIASGNIIIGDRVEGSGRFSTGSILIDAGGNVTLNKAVRSRAQGGGGTAPGGTVTIDAGGTVTSARRGRVDARGKKNVTNGGTVNVTGQSGVDLDGRIDARGDPGGDVDISCPAGDVSISDQIRTQGWRKGAGGSITIDAGGDIDSSTGTLYAYGNVVSAGTISLTAGDSVTARVLRADGTGVPGGTVAVLAATVSAEAILVGGGPSGGVIDVESTVGDTDLGRMVARGTSGPGGTIEVDSAADLTVAGNVRNGGDTMGGETRLAAAGNITLGTQPNTRFDSRGPAGGVIEAQAGGNLTAQGNYQAATGGCIGFSAGGTLDTSSATFDVPLSGSCP